MATSLRSLLIALLLCSPFTAEAESLPDPTRPAINLRMGVGGETEAGEVVEPPRGLQTIIISPEYRAAIINGETVHLGGKSGDSTLVEVRESSVVLQNAQGRRVLELFPKVNIKKNEAAQPARRGQGTGAVQPGLPRDAGEAK